MTSGMDSNSNQESQDPYSMLGIESGASFDAIQKARDKLIAELGDDPQTKAKIEASYDALLMQSLKERQLGKVSNAAASASQKEKSKKNVVGEKVIGSSILTRLKGSNTQRTDTSGKGPFPELSLPEGQGLTIRIAFGLLAVVLILVSTSGGIQLVLSFSTIGLFVSQIKRGRKPLPSLGWSILLLSIGLIIGGVIITGTTGQYDLTTPLSSDQLEALPAVLLLWAGALFLA